MQNIFTVTKAVLACGAGASGILVFDSAAANAGNFTNFWRNAALSMTHPYPPDNPTWMIGTLTLVGVAMVGSLFSMDAWNNVTFTAAEVKNPGRDLPLSLVLGTGIVISLYTLANIAYLRVLPISGDPEGRDGACARNRICCRRARRHGRTGSDLRSRGRDRDGCGHPGFHFWLQQRTDSFRRANLLRDGQGSSVSFNPSGA